MKVVYPVPRSAPDTISPSRATLASKDLAPGPLVTLMQARPTIEPIKKSYFRLAYAERPIPAPVARYITAHDPIKREQLTQSTLGRQDAVVTAQGIPKTTKVIAQTPEGLKTFSYPLFYYTSETIAPGVLDPLLTRYIRAISIVDPIPKSYGVLGSRDLPPIRANSVSAHNSIQSLMKTLSILATKDRVPDPLRSRRISAPDPLRIDMGALSILASIDRAPQPLIYKRDAHSPAIAEMKTLARLGYVDAVSAALDPLKGRRVIAIEAARRVIKSYHRLYGPDLVLDPLLTRRIAAIELAQASTPTDSIFVTPDVTAARTAYATYVKPYDLADTEVAPFVIPLEPEEILDPLQTRRIGAHDPIQLAMDTVSILASRENTPESRRSIGHDPIQKIMQALNILVVADAKPSPLITQKIAAFAYDQKEMRLVSKLLRADLASISTKSTAHDPLQRLMQAITILSSRDSAPDPLSARRTAAFAYTQQDMQTIAKLAIADVPLISRRTTAHDPLQKIMQTLNILGTTDFAPYPLLSKQIAAHDPLQKLMQAYYLVAPAELVPQPFVSKRDAHSPVILDMKTLAYLAYVDVAPSTLDPLQARRVIAQDILQKAMQTYSLVASLEGQIPEAHRLPTHDPIQLAMKVVSTLASADRVGALTKSTAHDPIQKLMQALSILGRSDFAPEPLSTRRVIANDLPQKLMQVYSLLASREAQIPETHKLATHDPVQLAMKALSILSSAEYIPDPLSTRRIVAHDIAQKSPQIYSLLAPVEAVPPYARRNIGHDPIQLAMETLTILAIAETLPDPLQSRRITAHDPIQSVMETLALLTTSDIAPDPLATRRVVAIDLTQKQMLTSTISITADFAPPSSLYIRAHDPLQKIMQSLSLVGPRDYAPDPLLTRKIVAFDLGQREMATLYKLDRLDPQPISALYPLARLANAAYDTPQKLMQALSVLATTDRAPDPLLTRKSVAIELVQKSMLTESILTTTDRSPIFVSSKAHDPAQKLMQALSILTSADYAPDPLTTRRVVAVDLGQKSMATESIFVRADQAIASSLSVKAHDPLQKLMQVLSVLTSVDAAPIFVSSKGHDPLQKVMQALSVLASTDYAPDPLLTRRVVAVDLAQKAMLTENILITADRAIPTSVFVKAHDPIQLVMETLSALATSDAAPDPLQTRKIVAFSLAQRDMTTFYKIDRLDPQPISPLYPLARTAISAHDPIQKIMQALSVLSTRDRSPDPLSLRVQAHSILQAVQATAVLAARAEAAPDPLRSRRVTAHDPLQAVMQTLATLASFDTRPDPLATRRVVAHNTIVGEMETTSVVASRDSAPDPLFTRKTVAFDIAQKEMLTESILVTADRSPVFTTAKGHEPIQKLMQAISVLASRDLAPDPLATRRVTAVELEQKTMLMESISVTADRASIFTSAKAHDPLQKIMQALSILANRDTFPDPLATRRIVAHDPAQAIMEALSLLASADRAPDPLSTRRVAAFELSQKSMQTYSKLGYADIVIALDPLRSRRISAHDPFADLMKTLSIVGTREQIPYPLGLKTAAHEPTQKLMQAYNLVGKRPSVPDPLLKYITAQDPTQKSMQAVALLIRPDFAPEPLISRYVRAHDPFRESMETTSLFVIPDRRLDPTLFHKIEAFDPTQKIQEPFWLLGVEENTPYPLLTRLITAHEPTQKFLLSRWLVGYGFPSSQIIHKFSGELLGRMWSAYYGRGWLGTEEKAWEGNQGRAWEGRHQRKWKR